MDIHHLVYFIEVARHRNFTKAAQALHISQPSISKMIKVLEEELGVRLFSRTTRQIELTDAGRAVLHEAQHIINSFQNLKSELSDVMQLKTGNILFGLPPMIGASFFSKIIGKFNQQYPGITIKLIEVGSRQVEYGIEDGSLDIGVVALPIVKEDAFEMLSFVKEPLMVITPNDHRLAAKAKVSLVELKDEPLAFYREDFSLHDTIIERCSERGFYPKTICESSQWDFIAEMVAAKLGVALLPTTICRDLDPKRIKSIPLVDPIIYWDLAIIWKKDKYIPFAVKEWIKFTSSLLGINYKIN
ncbi:MAG: LysR family transcriptional regulator [Veillonellaceae bacterium]|jgi:DNA-binding transcriptional LysR family regulator|nr:LysR family transcriptional regulator [Veillonellaceae bacterium]